MVKAEFCYFSRAPIFKSSPQPNAPTDFLQTIRFGKLKVHGFQKYMSAKVPRGGRVSISGPRSNMEVDSIHAAIERAKKSVPVYVPHDWYTVVRCARRKHPYSVIPMTHDDICDFSQMSDSVPHLSKIRWRNVKWLRYLRVEPAQIEVYVKDSFGDGDFHQLTRKTQESPT